MDERTFFAEMAVTCGNEPPSPRETFYVVRVFADFSYVMVGPEFKREEDVRVYFDERRERAPNDTWGILTLSPGEVPNVLVHPPGPLSTITLNLTL